MDHTSEHVSPVCADVSVIQYQLLMIFRCPKHSTSNLLLIHALNDGGSQPHAQPHLPWGKIMGVWQEICAKLPFKFCTKWDVLANEFFRIKTYKCTNKTTTNRNGQSACRTLIQQQIKDTSIKYGYFWLSTSMFLGHYGNVFLILAKKTLSHPGEDVGCKLPIWMLKIPNITE